MKKIMNYHNKLMTVFFIVGLAFTVDCFAHPSDEIFNDAYIHEYHLVFEQENFFDILNDIFDENLDIYLPATFEYNEEVYNNVGVRLKGHKSMSYPSNKKPFKIKFDAFEQNQEFHGLNKLCLNNEFKDPSFLREKLVYDVLNKYIPSSRTSFVKLFINGDYWGLYTNVEQVNKNFLERNLSGNSDGNLYKGDPFGDLIWYGEEQENYYNKYELKTNEEENDWSDLVEFINFLNFAEIEEFTEAIETKFHIHNFLFFSAINNYFVNLDSYAGGGHNYYLYHRTDTDKFLNIPWDFNYCMGVYNWGMQEDDIYNLPVLWENPFEDRPLINKMFAVEDYVNLFLMNYRHIFEKDLTETLLNSKIDHYADMIRDAVYADSLKMFTNEDFEQNLVNSIEYENQTIFGLKTFIHNRNISVSEQLTEFVTPEPASGLFINEFMARNNSTISDEYGDFDDWIEIYNDNDHSVNLKRLFLTDDPATSDKFKLPEVEIEAHGHLIIWADDEIEQGELHTNFKLSGNGEYIGLYDIDGIIAVDEISFGEQTVNISFGRENDGYADWMSFSNPTPGFQNYEPTCAEDEQMKYDPIASIGNFPNPFNPETKIFFDLKSSSDVVLCVYNSRGQFVKTLVNEKLASGEHSAVWNGDHTNGNKVSSGVYFYKISTGEYCATSKMVLVK